MDLTPALTTEYSGLWTTCAIRPERVAEVDQLVDRIETGKPRYTAAGPPLGIPWHVVGIIHMLECSGNFATQLHNGDPLAARTVHVPAGRPPTGQPPFTWQESATDALEYEGLNVWKDWSVPGTLFVFERYNGFGYRSHGINTPYLWSFSNHYASGKYVQDGVFSPTAVSEQCGAAVLLSRMVARGLTTVTGAPPPATGILQLGSKGPAVGSLKALLKHWFDANMPGEWETLAIAPNDTFGAHLDRAVRIFQQRAGIAVDGRVGTQTLGALRSQAG